MFLDQLISGMPLRLVYGSGQVVVTDLTDDSREVGCGTAGCAFVARKGTAVDGGDYIDQAISRGAVAVIADRIPDRSYRDRASVAWVVAPLVDQILAGRLARKLFDHPDRSLKLIGITGTNGKTTTGMMVHHLLGRGGRRGRRCGLVGTIVNDDGVEPTPARLTTPGAIELSRLLAAMVHNGCDSAVVEVSSHALAQGRTTAHRFSTAVFTNLTGDHQDYHDSMEAYASAKALLFAGLAAGAKAVVNADDPYYAHRMVRDCKASVSQFSVDGAESADYRAVVQELAADYSRARFDGPWGSVDLRLPTIGRHNIANALAALAAADAVASLTPDLCRALEDCPAVPGRLEPVRSSAGPGPSIGPSPGPAVLVDYAHTHDALENVLVALRPLTKGKLVALFGCGGDRDRTKRPKMAAVVCQLADRVVITSDNPRTEDPLAIIEDIRKGVPEDVLVQVEPDRAAAIKLAITEAEEGDIVLLAGKGHELYQEIGTTRHDFDDRQQAATVLRH